MLQKAQSYVTWGEPSTESIILLLKKRGRIVGNKKLTDEHAQKIGYDSLEKLAEALENLEVEFKNLEDVKPIFRLHPPRKGYKGTVKKNFRAGGAAGYRGEAINTLIRQMT
jgi:large subunit ribosomal protein L30